jgi:hypothetical protein
MNPRREVGGENPQPCSAMATMAPPDEPYDEVLMSFANPIALFWAALAIPIAIFYILKIRLRRVPVSTIIFWRQIFEEKQPRSIWQHLRHLISLLVQLALLGLLVLALAEPFLKWEILEARRLVLVIDNSASMNATDVTPTRLEHAKREALKIIDALRFRDEMAIVAAGTQPQVACGLTGHQKTLRKAVESIPPRDGPTRVADAVELARRLLTDQKNRKVVVLSDGCYDGASDLAGADDVQWLSVGEHTGNIGITRFQVRRSLLDPLGYEILAEVSNFSDDPVECRLELELDGDVIDVVPLKLEPGGEWSNVFEKTSAGGGRLLAKIERPDALMQDNQAWAVLPQRERQAVLLVTDGNLFLQRVLEAAPLVNLTVASELPEQVTPGTIVVLHRKASSTLPPGPVLVIEPPDSTELWELGEKLENPIVTKLDKGSALMAHVRLDNVIMPEAHKLTPTGKAQALATSLTGDPLYLALDRPSGKLLVLTVNLDQGDLPLRTAFPIMMTNAIGWFAGTKGDLRESLATGALTEVELASGAGTAPTDRSDMPASNLSYVLRSPTGESRPIPPGMARVTVGPFDQCGMWIVERVNPTGSGGSGTSKSGADVGTKAASADAQRLEIACNLANRRESDIRPLENMPSKDLTLGAGVGGRPIWFYLIATAWLLAAFEWFMYQRRWIS